MLTNELIGKTITNIYQIVEFEHYGLDKGECFVELDNKIIIDIPFGESEEVWIKDLNKKAVSLFNDLNDYPVYHVNPEGKTIKEIADKYQKERRTIYNRIKKIIFGLDVSIKEYKPYKVEYRENKLKYIRNKTIIDFIWFPDEVEKGYLLLDNGYLISETTVANNGTGLAGLNYYKTIEEIAERYNSKFVRLTDSK